MLDSTRFGMFGWALCGASVCVCTLGACGPSTRHMTVELRDAATRSPIVGAGVEADSLALGPSLELSDVLDQALGKRSSLMSRALTDERGRATLEVVPDRSIRILALLAGQPPSFALFDHAGTIQWRPMSTDPGASAPEIMVRDIH